MFIVWLKTVYYPRQSGHPSSSTPSLYVFVCMCPQVFHVPVEERKYVSHESSFGERAADITQAGIVRDIMEKTGCTIEMSQAKDQSLTIMVTGRPSSVIEARRMILSSLQQQVRKGRDMSCAV